MGGTLLLELGSDFCELHRRDKPRRFPGRADLGVELIDLFERQALGLVDAEIDEGHTDAAEALCSLTN